MMSNGLKRHEQAEKRRKQQRLFFVPLWQGKAYRFP